MKWYVKLWREFIMICVVLYIGDITVNDTLYNYYLKQNNWKAFFYSPYRYIKYNGELIR